MTLPDVTDLIADTIIQEREGWYEDQQGRKEDSSFKSPDDMLARVPELSPKIRGLVTTESAIYRISSIGNVGGVRFEIWCIVQRGAKEPIVLRWREQD